MSARGCWGPGLCRLGKSVLSTRLEQTEKLVKILRRGRGMDGTGGALRGNATRMVKNGETRKENMHLTLFVRTV